MHMNRPGTIIKASTIHDLKPESVKEHQISVTYRVYVSLVKNLVEASKNTGYSQNELVNRALDAFLK